MDIDASSQEIRAFPDKDVANGDVIQEVILFEENEGEENDEGDGEKKGEHIEASLVYNNGNLKL